MVHRNGAVALCLSVGTVWDIALIVFADALYRGEPITTFAGPFETVATLLGIVLTSIYLVGLLERKNRTFARMGYDSRAVSCSYAAGVVLLSFIQAS